MTVSELDALIRHKIHRAFPYLFDEANCRRHRIRIERVSRFADRRVDEFLKECQELRDHMRGGTHGDHRPKSD